MSASNMKIWDAVSKTDPSHTKHVNQRGGFTAINAHSQIMAATEQFGPVGEGWGFNVIRVEVHHPFVIVHVSLWHGERENEFGPILGCAEMFGNRPDSDAPKKATTDAITKGLSLLGFNADVFLGKWDDQKYVDERTREVSRPAADAIQSKVDAIATCSSLEELQAFWINLSADLRAVKEVERAKDERKSALLSQAKAA